MKRSRILVTAGAAAFALSLSACGGGDEAAGGADEQAPDSSMSTPMETPSETEGMDEGMATPSESADGAMMDPAANLVGPGCEGYAEQVPDGAGSVSGMAQDPVATAASNNPLLTQLTAAVSGGVNPDVNLVDDLNGAQDITVFAPVDEAFAALDQATLDTLSSPEGAETLTSILTYHVVTEPVDPTAPEGEYTTLQGGDLTVSGTGDEITVNTDTDAPASVICGGVQTANATVYLIDSLLMPAED